LSQDHNQQDPGSTSNSIVDCKPDVHAQTDDDWRVGYQSYLCAQPRYRLDLLMITPHLVLFDLKYQVVLVVSGTEKAEPPMTFTVHEHVSTKEQAVALAKQFIEDWRSYGNAPTANLIEHGRSRLDLFLDDSSYTLQVVNSNRVIVGMPALVHSR
jgi:hypothetical protein